MTRDQWRSLVAHGRASLARRTRAIWSRDRATLRGWRALANRLGRIAILTVRGLAAHRLGMQAAALTYYTVFSIVPLLVVVLWIVKAFDHLPLLTSDAPDAHLSAGNSALHSTLRQIIAAVDRRSAVTSGIVGLVALLYAITRLFRYVERAVDTIAGSDKRRPRLSRLFRFAALLLLPPAVLAASGTLTRAARGGLGADVARFLHAIPGLEQLVGVAIGVGLVWLAVTLLYTAAARARIDFAAAATGGLAAALGLPVVLWAFTTFQIGVSRSNAIQSGIAAAPVFMLWAFFSWYVVLVGAEIAVASSIDRVLVHGARCFRLDAVGEQETAVAIMERARRDRTLAVDALARDLRLPPNLIRGLCRRLADRGLLAPTPEGFELGRELTAFGTAEVVEAIRHDPDLDPLLGRPPIVDGGGAVTLRQQ